MPKFTKTARLSVKGFALAGGLLWMVALVLWAAINIKWSWGEPFLDLIASAYSGFALTGDGIFVGALWAFADGFIGCAAFAWLYNKFRKV